LMQQGIDPTKVSDQSLNDVFYQHHFKSFT